MLVQLKLIRISIYMGANGLLLDMVSMKITPFYHGEKKTDWLAETCADISTQCWHRSVCVLTTHLCFCGCALYTGPYRSKISLWLIKTNIALAQSGQTHRGLGLCTFMMGYKCECNSICRQHIMDESPNPRFLSELSPIQIHFCN